MELSVLSENCAGGRFFAEHGLSYLIDLGERKILFDTGHSDVFLRNAALLGIDIQNQVDLVVLSHGHWDHGNGLKYLHDKTIIVHPAAFIRRFRKGGNLNIGLELSKLEIQSRFKLIESQEPYRIAENIIFAGGVPRNSEFESKTTQFIDEGGNEDFVPDDSALIIIEDNELMIISGCAHSGICNIIEYAKIITGLDKVRTVIGGFHLKEVDDQTLKTLEYFCRSGIKNIIPSHCTELPALCMFYQKFAIKQLKTGQVLTL